MTDANSKTGKHDKDAERRAGKELPPTDQQKMNRQNQTERGSGEGVTGMQRGVRPSQRALAIASII